MVTERGQLPIADSHDEILEAIQKNQVVLIRGETGSGKTTQVVIILLLIPTVARSVAGTHGKRNVCSHIAHHN